MTSVGYLKSNAPHEAGALHSLMTKFVGNPLILYDTGYADALSELR
jgi:hypothetical protein